jgi:hypothetical protein
MPKRRFTVYEVLDMVRDRPPMYLGDYRIHSLQNLVAGMHWAGAEDGGNAYKDFSNWCRLVFAEERTWAELEADLGDRRALETFLLRLDRYRECTLIDIATAFGPSRTWPREPDRPQPAVLRIAQYRPTEVFILRKFMGREDLNENFASDCFASVEEARDFAATQWSVPATSWRPASTAGPS